MSSLHGRRGFSPLPPFFIKVDTVGVSMYNRGLEAMPMENWLLFVGLLGVIVGCLESIRGDIER
tara:strand:- start:365 stop:556 length:192 start_codon:yes stop_codon:yes gene_type:complete